MNRPQETPFALDQLQIATPCSAEWEGMRGDDRTRFCEHCRKHVYNLSEMTRAEAETLIHAREGRLCVRMYRRADGTVLTADCPRGLAAVRQRLRRAAIGAAALAALLLWGVVHAFGMARGSSAGRVSGSLERLRNILSPPTMALGGICAPPIGTLPVIDEDDGSLEPLQE